MDLLSASVITIRHDTRRHRSGFAISALQEARTKKFATLVHGFRGSERPPKRRSQAPSSWVESPMPARSRYGSERDQLPPSDHIPPALTLQSSITPLHHLDGLRLVELVACTVVLSELNRERDMSIDRHEWISKRAYALWEEAGRTDGLDNEHWRLASVEFDFMRKRRASPDGAEILRFRSRPAIAGVSAEPSSSGPAIAASKSA
jgi:hypothetical protein